MLPPLLPPPAVYYFPPAAAYHRHGESEEWDMNAPTSAASVQSLAAASFQLLGKWEFRQSCQSLPRSHGARELFHRRCAGSGSLRHQGADEQAAGGGSGGDNIWTHPRRAHLLML